MAKVTKGSSTIPMVTDLFVKLTKLFDDMYIIRGSILIPGSRPSEGILGNVMCRLEPNYAEAFQKFAEGKSVLYIGSVKKMKEWLQTKPEWEPTDEIRWESSQYMVEITKEESIEAQINRATEFENRILPPDGKMHWRKCIGEDKKLLETLFGISGIFDMPIFYDAKDKEPGTVMSMAKQLLPLISEKNATVAYIGTTGKRTGDNDELLDVVLDCRLPYFQMCILYTVMILPWTPEKTAEEIESSDSESEDAD